MPGRLSPADARALAELMQLRARMGEFEAQGVELLARHLKKRDVFSAMLDVSKGKGFIKRVSAEFAELPDWQKNLVFLLALLSAGGLESGLTEAQFATGVSSDRIQTALRSDHHLAALIEQVDGLVSSRQRDKTLPEVISALGAANALARLVAMVAALKPLATSASLKVRNRPALMLGHLMGNRLLRAYFPHEQLEGFYETLAPEFGEWNGKFWEQRAINAKRDGHWSKAESYAARAVTLFPATYTRTTFGTILLNRAREAAHDDFEQWTIFYKRGLEQFDLVGTSSDESRVAVFAYLTAALDLLKALKSRGSHWESEVAETVREDWVYRYAMLRLGLRGQEASIDSIVRADTLSNGYETLTSATLQPPVPDADPTAIAPGGQRPIVGTTHASTVCKVLGYGYLVEIPLLGRARITFRNQSRSSGVPSFIPTLAVGDVIRVLILDVRDHGRTDAVFAGMAS